MASLTRTDSSGKHGRWGLSGAAPEIGDEGDEWPQPASQPDAIRPCLSWELNRPNPKFEIENHTMITKAMFSVPPDAMRCDVMSCLCLSLFLGSLRRLAKLDTSGMKDRSQ